MNLREEITQDLLAIKAVQINPDHYFTWTSGVKAPIYCDNRLTMSYPVIREKICQAFLEKLERLTDKPDVIAGCATAGIPHAAWLANQLNLPMIYVRSKAKSHGKQNQIEGGLQTGQKVVVIEDLISTGGSVLETAKAVKKAGGDVIQVLAIFSYGLNKASENFNDQQIPFQTITNFDQLLDALVQNGSIHDGEKDRLLAWRHHLS